MSYARLFITLLLLLCSFFASTSHAHPFRNMRRSNSKNNLGGSAVDARNLRTFSTAKKGVTLCPCKQVIGGIGFNCTGSKTFHGCADATDNYEAEMMNIQVAPSQQAPVNSLRLIWCTGDLIWPAFGNSTMRIYVDGETEASLAFTVYEARALAFGWDEQESKTWGNKYIGKGSLFGGLYLAIPIPFKSSLRVTVALPQLDIDLGIKHGFYFIARGLYNMPIFIDSNILLPENARLKMQRVQGTQQPHQRVSLYKTKSNATSGGSIFYLVLIAQSPINHFLEGEFSALVDSDTERMVLSSGTEDGFLSAQYFDALNFALPHSGATHVSLGCLDAASECRVAAYRFFDADPVFWQEKIDFQWMVGDPFWKVAPVNITALTFSYEW